MAKRRNGGPKQISDKALQAFVLWAIYNPGIARSHPETTRRVFNAYRLMRTDDE